MDKFLLPIPVDASYSAKAPRNFKLPPLDSSMLLPEIFDWHLENNPRHPVFVFENDDVGYTYLTYSEIVPAAHRAGRLVGRLVGVDVDEPSQQMRSPVAMMATTDMVTYFCTMLGMMRAGIPILSFSHRNSPQAVAHLLRRTQCGYLLISPEPSMFQVAHAACEILASDGVLSKIPQILVMPEYKDIFSREPYVSLVPRKYDNDVPAILIHSSGSTSLPKPIPWSHQFLLQCGVAPLYGAQNYCGEIFAFHSLSMSYGGGIHLLGWVPASGMIIATYRPKSPAQPCTPPSALKAFESISADYIVTFPHYIEEWSRSKESRKVLKRAKRVVYIGGFLNTNVGNDLAKEGIELYPLFGMGEAGIIAEFFPPNQGLSWEYFPITPHSGGVFTEVGDGMYEISIIRSPTKDARITNITIGANQAFRARDLFIPHPTQPGYWKVVGRQDDRILHSNGEKTDPVPLEHVLNSDPRVKATVIFGHGWTRNGVLVELCPEFYFDPEDESKLRKFRSSYRSTLQRMNKIAPGHSRIFPEMVITTTSSKPFTYTLKGSLQRSVALSAYAEEIANVYESTNSSTQKFSISPSSSLSEITELVRSIILDSLLLVSDDDDIFHHGCDSLKAMRIENQLRSVFLKSDGIDVSAYLPRWFLYNYSTPRKIAAFLFSLVSQNVQDVESRTAEDILNVLLDDLDTLPVRTQADNDSLTAGSESVIITGTTGDLGANVLQELVRDQSISRIYAFVRKASESESGVSPRQRLAEVFVDRGLDKSVLDSEKVRLVEVDFAEDGVGIEKELLAEMRNEVSRVFHLAWPVNWNMNVSSFQDILTGTKNLVKFALSFKATPTFIFSSSIGVFCGTSLGSTEHPNQDLLDAGMNQDVGSVPETPLFDLKLSQGMGYAEAKAVAEIFLNKVSQKTNLNTVILRIGQITGSSWSTSHWFPMIVKTSITMGYFPDMQGNASWLDVTTVARAVVEMKDAPMDINVVHVLHPRPRPIDDIIQHVAQQFSLPVIPHSKWLEKLQNADSKELQTLPALKIMHFLERQMHPESEAPGLPVFEVNNAIEMSDYFRTVEDVSMEDVDGWVEYWKKCGYLQV